MLDLGGIASILEIRANGTLELRDLLVKNIATEASLNETNVPYLRPDFTLVSGMLTWPSFYAEPGALLRVYNTTQYFWADTVFFRPDCNFNSPGTPPDNKKVRTD